MIKQRLLEFPSFKRWDDIQAIRWSGQKAVFQLYGFDAKKKLAILKHGLAGTYDVWLYEAGKHKAGTFLSSKMSNWIIDPGTLERLRFTFETGGKRWKLED